VPASAPPRLTLESRTANKVTDVDAWYKQHGVKLPLVAVNDMPAFLPTTLRGERLTAAIDHGDHRVLIYGGRVVAVLDGSGSVVKVLDFTAYTHAGGRSQELRWAQVRGGALFVMHTNPNYASESNGANAFVSAIDLARETLAWRSQPLVANGQNFVLHGAYLITGYGFTAEPDFVYVLELATGKVAQKTPITTSPDIFIEQRGKLLVRGYDADFVFAIHDTGSPGAESAFGRARRAPLVLSASGVALPTPNEDDECLRERAIALLDRGDFEGALRALFALSRDYRQHPAVASLVERTRAITTGMLSLQRDPIVLARPPFEQTLHASRPIPGSGAPPQLVQRSTQKNGARLPDTAAWLRKFGEGYPQVMQIAPAFDGKTLPPAAIPARYGNEPIRRILDHGDHLALIYGDRYLVIVRDSRAEAAYDFAAYLEPTRASDEADARFVRQDLTWAEVRDGVLYAAHGGGSYAREVYGKKGFITALDAKTGELLWRSSPLVNNANFVLVGGYLMTGYGFTDEPDFLFVLDRRDGKTVSRHALASAPEILVLKGDELFLRGFDTDYVFSVKPAR